MLVFFLFVNWVGCKQTVHSQKGPLNVRLPGSRANAGKAGEWAGVTAFVTPAGGWVAPGRFELPSTVSKTVVLPLDDGAGQ